MYGDKLDGLIDEKMYLDKVKDNKARQVEIDEQRHHLRPNGKGGNEYLDGKGNPVPKGHDKAHIYTGE